ncbi:hypothetical protein GCM10009676_10270 [Prauserella halophila]|uniref:Uncharacterized protein n=1 Tax=Prauserella halophila TaxID=185641 RepID=A0ABP4GR42_9PSEU|nr:hypothetical protein [Prauserella halophila]MCP2235384.1 hypothetical protein [Prauserella halophila]
MDRELYKRWHNHPVRSLLNRAEQGDHIHADELDDLRLPDKQHRAAESAITRLRNGKAPGWDTQGAVVPAADQYSAEIVDALGPDHETREQYEQRRALAGDATAAANIRARKEASDGLADDILASQGVKPA